MQVHENLDMQTTGIPVPQGGSYAHQLMDPHQQLAHYHHQLAQFNPQVLLVSSPECDSLDGGRVSRYRMVHEQVLQFLDTSRGARRLGNNSMQEIVHSDA